MMLFNLFLTALVLGSNLVTAATDFYIHSLDPAHVLVAPALNLGAGKTLPSQLQINSFTWGAQNTINIGSAGGGAGKVSFSQFVITKNVDANSPMFFSMNANGRNFNSLNLIGIGRTGSTTTSTPYFTLHFIGVHVASVNISWSGDSMIETVAFAYQQVVEQFVPQSSNGAFTTPVTYGWNGVQNIANNDINATS